MNAPPQQHPATCISGSGVPFHFKCCLVLCLFGIIVIYHSIYSASWENGFFDRNASGKKNPKQCENSSAELHLALGRIEKKIDWTRMCSGEVSKAEYDSLFPPFSENQLKYVLANWGGLCGGLGNQMWRFASLYGIGKPYGRRPIYTTDQNCLKDHGPHEEDKDNEIPNLFPVYSSQLKYIKVDPNTTEVVESYTSGCCTYDDPQRVKFSRFQKKYVQIKSYYFQSYKFFESRRQEIRQIFQFSPSICSTVKAYRDELFSHDNAHKLCVHTRIEDFKQFGFESKKNFSEKAIEFIHQRLKKTFGHVSVVLLGAEKDFLANLFINRTIISTVYLPKAMSRGEDLAFATIACDSLLITAPSSTFSWWMGYLMPDNANVFYDSVLEKTPYTRENFLPEWTPIKLLNDSSIVLD